ncbi:zinc finger BED domain-containing protein DAYSLEEPER-like [Salvia miltiorrhiza]|nr:zinc finger BED domain-containing protein DAYSLEEPER-like [Salvia miltiorrhiza]
MKLNDFLSSNDEVIKDMARKMKVKFDKYWESYSTTLALGCVLDPKRKLAFLLYVYKKLYPNDYEAKLKIVKDALYKLFAEYERVGALNSRMTPITSSSSINVAPDMDEYDKEFLQQSACTDESELDLYLEDKTTLDVIDYWKLSAKRFPRLAMMASDILSIPITTVASESTFSIGGRILHKYRNCLLPENVQALICTRNWLHGFEVAAGPGDDSDEQDSEESRLSKEDSNIVDVESLES